MKKAILSLLLAALLWFLMFSPWTAQYLNFWLCMSISGMLLTTLATLYCPEWLRDIRVSWQNVLAGLAVAVVLWVVFWVGDKVSQLMFDFARPQVNEIYNMGDGTSKWLICALLLFVIGPAEEIFWRGFVQRRFSAHWNPNIGFVVATLCYTLVHIWSFNFMLICAAGVVGACWGLLYRLRPQSLTVLIVSHALWDAAAFVVFPF